MTNPTPPTSSSHTPGEDHDHLPSAATGPTFLGHPRGLFLLFLVEMWERFSYYGMRGLLVLYLTAAIAAHQLAPGTHTNDLAIDQTSAVEKANPTDADPPTQTLIVPMLAEVGKGDAGRLAVSGTPGPLRFELVTPNKDPNAAQKWIGSGTFGITPPKFYVDPGVRPSAEGEINYRITNPTEEPIKLLAKIRRTTKDNPDSDDPNAKVYFKVNDSSSVVSTTIRPDSKLDPDHPPFIMSIDINRTDSGRSWRKADANVLYGWYTGFAYLLPILGGFIADKLIGTHRSMVVGGILIAAGHIILGLSGIGSMALSDTGMSVFVMGLALITIGTGHFKPSVSVMVGQLYPLNDPRRESAFSIFYMGINLGSFLSNLGCGYLAVAYGWHYGFAAAAVGMILGLVTYVAFRSKYLPGVGEPVAGNTKAAPLFLPVGVVLAAGIAYLYHLGILGKFDEFMGNPWVNRSILAAAVAYAVWFIIKQDAKDRGPVATIFIYMLFNAVFWLSFEQAGSSLNTFTDELTNRHILGWEVPSPYFQSINPLLIIIFAPIFGLIWASLARKNKSIAQPYKIGMGLIFVGLGYIVMVLAALRLQSGLPKVGMIFISGCYFLHTVGEIILSPTGLSYVAKTAPKKSVSSLMGIWFISSFIAGLGAGKVAALVDPIIEGKVKLPWNLGGQADFFLLFVLSSVAAGVLVILLGPLLTRLQRDRTH